ncbi:MAG: GMC family oxidoreductase [Chloroflexi bacterium]|nr:GMC family oxidoreductase [Chloroflexota bacterium]
MIVDSRSLPEGEIINTDVCIVGAGTAGITLAREFIGADFQVCLLESGGLKADQETQFLYKGTNVGLPYYEMDKSRVRFFGGSSHRWHVNMGDNEMGVRLRPFDPIDFENRDWVPYSGWPFNKAHLAPYYDRAQTICQINPPTFATDDWADMDKRPSLPFANGNVKTIIYKIGTRDPFTKQYVKEVTDANNVTSFLYANALEIETDEQAQRAAQLRVATLAGNTFYVAAKLFVLASGGIEIPRLLLSSNKAQPTGLGNQHDLVGRFFMEHLHFWSGVFIPANPGIFQKTDLYNDVHKVNQVAVIGKLALSEKTLRQEKLLNQNIQLIPRLTPGRYRYPLIEANNAADRLTNNYRKARRKLSKYLNQQVAGYRLANMTEQMPNPDSRVTLMTERDQLGQRRAQLDWQVTKQDIQSVIRTQEIIATALEQANIGRLHIDLRGAAPPPGLHGGYHHMGTTRMHIDPKQGIVDANSRMHSVNNLYIAGPSVFPTGGYANPVLTMLALTVRLADHIKRVMQKGGDS